MAKTKGTTSYSVAPQVEELRRKLGKLAASVQREALGRALMAGGEVIEAAANAKAPGPNIHAEIDKELTPTLAAVSVGPDKRHWYYQFAETGAQPHEIGPKRRSQLKAIRFSGAQGDVFARVVSHPGAPARPFLRPAIVENEQRALEATYAALVLELEKVK